MSFSKAGEFSGEALLGVMRVVFCAGLKARVLGCTSLQDLNVDTQAQKKTVNFPADERLYRNLCVKLVG